jgi:flagellar basal body-associated protein FliL
MSVVDNEEVPPAEDVPGVPKKKKGGALITLVGALVIASMSSAAGATFGPSIKQKLLGGHPPAAGEHAEEAEEKSEKGGHIAPLDSLVVDVHDEGGENHHVKVGLALEVAGEPVNEEEWKAEVVPKARDACISYLRSLKYDEASSSAKFESIRTELQERISKAVKKPKVKHVFFIDYVVQ